MTRLFSSLTHYLRDVNQEDKDEDDDQQGEQQNKEKLDNGSNNKEHHRLPKGITESEISELLSRKECLLDAAWELLEDPDWKLAHEKSPVRVLSQKSRRRPAGKAWRLETVVNLPASRMFEEMWDRVDQQTAWNPNLVFSDIVARLTPDATILHNATAETAGGLVKARDFVTLCVRGRRAGVEFTGGASIETGLVPPRKRFVRGENYPGCIACLPVTPYSSKLVWIMDSDIKGWIPTGVIDQAMTSVVSQLGFSIQQLASKIVLKEKRTVSIDDSRAC